jgi:hypothetical protein
VTSREKGKLDAIRNDERGMMNDKFGRLNLQFSVSRSAFIVF